MTRDEYLQYGAFAINPRGEAAPAAKLTEEKVRAIRANRHGKTAKALAAEYGVHIRTIDQIRLYKSWTHVV